MRHAEVALPLPLRQTFTYLVPESLAGLAAGDHVQVPFRGRTRTGFVVAVGDQPLPREARTITGLIERGALSPHLLELAHWIADYYLAPLGEVIAAALPGGLEGFGASRARKGAREERTVRLALPERVTLTAGQHAALSAAEAAVRARRFAPLLLEGVTGSGKTEVYLRAAQAAREAGLQTLVLVPEVALGTQVVGLFRRRFGARVGVLHSYLTVGERRRNWQLARAGGLDVVVGARSAVFAPLPQPGLIVVDEEHEPSYKQSQQIRYHGRDTAVRRAQLLGIPVLLGSATPSLETLANAARGRYRRIRLPDRVERRPLPSIRVVDLREEPQRTLLSASLREAIAARLQRREQVLLFLNRRGFARHVQCRSCGFVPHCPHCDIALTLHVAPPSWRCHYCDHAEPPAARCPECRSDQFRHLTGGTQRVEREIAAGFPAARVLRVDADVRRREGHGAVLDAFRSGEGDVLVGTQMIAKGLDFPKVTLAGVIDADVGLNLPDFRAAERTWQLLVQVSGRAGRSARGGEVIIQTCTPDHPAIAAAATNDPRRFRDRELEARREAGYPPFTRLVALLFTGRNEDDVESAASECAEAIRANAGAVEVLGPAPQLHARIRGQTRWHVLLKGGKVAELHEKTAAALDFHAGAGRRSTVRMAADVDPVEVL